MRRLAAALLALVLAGPAAVAGPGTDQEDGQTFHLTTPDLPPPQATESVANGAEVIARPEDATLRVPPGFAVNLFAGGIKFARWMAVADNGDVILAQSQLNKLTIVRDEDGDGAADLIQTFADGFVRPHGLAIHEGYLYVADLARVWRIPYAPGDDRAAARAEGVTPGRMLGGTRGHWTRDIAFAADGAHFFVAIGSQSNVAEEQAPRATIQMFDADGRGRRTFAAGLRNPVGIAIQPGTGDLYATVNERDGLGDGLVPDYLTRVQDGDFFGWPYAYIGPNPDPDFGELRPDLVAATKVPDVLFAAHSAPLGLVFYDRDQFPTDYRGDAFVALHGSWNSSQPTGYKIVRVPFENGRPTGTYQNFAVGFWAAGEATAQVWGRPAGLAVAKDGSLLIADDTGGAIWRVSYAGPP